MAYGSISAPIGRARVVPRGGPVARIAPTGRPVPRMSLAGIRPAATSASLEGLTPGGWRLAPITAAQLGRAGAGGALTNRGVIAYPPQYAGYDDYDDFEGLGGLSIKGVFRAVKKIASPVQHVLTNVGHAVGSAATSKIGQGILGGALALTGVGFLPAAGIFAATKGVGNLIKPGGNLKHTLTGAGQGALEGLAAAGTGKAVRAIASKIANRGKTPSIAGTATDITGQLAKTGIQVMTDRNNPSPYDSVTAGLQADAASITSGNAYDAAIAARVAGQQAADLQAQLNAAQASANQAAVQQLQQQLADAQAQATAAAQAAAAANAASGGVQSGAADAGQLQQLLAASNAANQAAQGAAMSPSLPSYTSGVQDAADAATDQTADALAGGDVAEAGILSHPGLLLGGIVVLALMTGKPKRSRRRR